MGRGGRGDGYGGWGWGGWGGAEGAQWQHPGGQVGWAFIKVLLIPVLCPAEALFIISYPLEMFGKCK